MSTATARQAADSAQTPVRDATARLGRALGQRALAGTTKKIGSATQNLTAVADGKTTGASLLAKAGKNIAEGSSPLRAVTEAGLSRVKDKAVEGAQGLKEAVGLDGKHGGGGKGKKIKTTTIIETADVGVPVDVAYDQWTNFTDFPSFMKKIEHVEQEEDDKLTWQAQVFWSHRTWQSTIVEQSPDERIVWRSSGEKGYTDGAVSFHELSPDLTRILLVLEYHPKGLFEHVGNIWRAQGRRARLELKHFQRHVMTQTVLNTDELEGWRGEIHDGEVIPPEEAGEGDEDAAEPDGPDAENDTDEADLEDVDREDADDQDADEEDADDQDADEEDADDQDRAESRRTKGRSRS